MVFEKIFAIFLVILAVVLISIKLIALFKRLHKAHYETIYYSYVPEFENKKIENYYYKVYEVMSINYRTSSDRSRGLLIKNLRVVLLSLFFLCAFIAIIEENRFFGIIEDLSFIGLLILPFVIIILPKVIHKEVIPKVIKYVNKTLTYTKNGGVSSIEYDDAYAHNYDVYSCNDLIQGVLRSCNFKMSEVHTEEEIRISRDEVKYKTVFHGVVVIVDLSNMTVRDEVFDTGFYNLNNKLFRLNRDLSDEYETKIVGDKLYLKFDTGGIFDTDYSNEREESLSLANDLYNLETMLNIVDDIIVNIVE